MPEFEDQSANVRIPSTLFNTGADPNLEVWGDFWTLGKTGRRHGRLFSQQILSLDIPKLKQVCDNVPNNMENLEVLSDGEGQ